MSLAATQANIILNQGRMSDLSSQMQITNYERLRLAMEESGLLSELMSLQVPTAPNEMDFYSTSYSFDLNGNTINIDDYNANRGQDGYNYDIVFPMPITSVVYNNNGSAKVTPSLAKGVDPATLTMPNYTQNLKTFSYPAVNNVLKNKTQSPASLQEYKNVGSQVSFSNSFTTSSTPFLTPGALPSLNTNNDGTTSISYDGNTFNEASVDEYLAFYHMLKNNKDFEKGDLRLYKTNEGSFFGANISGSNPTYVDLASTSNTNSEARNMLVKNTLYAETKASDKNSIIIKHTDNKNKVYLGEINPKSVAEQLNINGEDFTVIDTNDLGNNYNDANNSSLQHGEFIYYKNEDGSKVFKLEYRNIKGFDDETKELTINNGDSSSFLTKETFNGCDLTDETLPSSFVNLPGDEGVCVTLPNGQKEYFVKRTSNTGGFDQTYLYGFDSATKDGADATINGKDVRKIDHASLKNIFKEGGYNTEKYEYYQNPETGEIWEYNPKDPSKSNIITPEVSYTFDGHEGQLINNWSNMTGIDPVIKENKDEYDCYLINGKYTFIPKTTFEDGTIEGIGTDIKGNGINSGFSYEKKDSLFVNNENLVPFNGTLPNNIVYDNSKYDVYAVYPENDEQQEPAKFVLLPKDFAEGTECSSMSYSRAETNTGLNNIERKRANFVIGSSGQLTSVDIEGLGTFNLTFGKVKDDEAWDKAQEKYKYDKNQYDELVDTLNKRIEQIQVKDKYFELDMQNMQTEYNTLSKQIESLQQILNKAIEKSAIQAQ